MNYRELLELAAKAAGMDVEWVQDDHDYSDFSIGSHPSIKNFQERDKAHWEVWAPELNASQSMHLAAKAGLRVDFNYRTGKGEKPGVGVWAPGDSSPFPPFWTAESSNICSDAMWTILRAAASIGKEMP